MRAPLPEDAAATDDARMVRLQEGDGDAFEEIVAEHRGPLIGFFFRNSRDIQLAEDLAQETLLKVYNQSWDYIPMGRFRPWMYRMARNLLIDTVRRQSRDVVLLAHRGGETDDEGDRLARLAGEVLPPEMAVQAGERKDYLDALLAELPEEQRQTVTLHYYTGMPLPEVAEVMQTNVSTCKSRLRLAREKLRLPLETSGLLDTAPA